MECQNIIYIYIGQLTEKYVRIGITRSEVSFVHDRYVFWLVVDPVYPLTCSKPSVKGTVTFQNTNPKTLNLTPQTLKHSKTLKCWKPILVGGLQKGNLFVLGISSSQLTFIQRSIEELKPATSYKSNRFFLGVWPVISFILRWVYYLEVGKGRLWRQHVLPLFNTDTWQHIHENA